MARTCYGGVEQVMANVLPLLARHSRVVFCDLVSNPAYAQLLRDKGVEVLHLLPEPRRNFVGGAGTVLRPLLIAAKLPWLLRSRMRLRSWIREHSPDLVYFNRLPVVRAFAGVIPEGIPCLYHAHGYSSSHDIRPGDLRRLRKFKSIVAVSELTRSQLLEAGLNPDMLHVVYNAVDVERIRAAAAGPGPMLPPRRPETTVFLHCGAMVCNKAQDIAIEAFALLPRRRDAQLWLCGGHDRGGHAAYFKSLHERVAELGLGDQVHFLGWRDDVPRLMAATDIVLLPSRYFESFGMVLAEGMCLARPCIGTARGGVPEVITDGVTGLIREPLAGPFAEAMQQLMDDPTLCRQMGEAGYQKVRSVFSLDRQAELLRQIICNAMTAPSLI